MTGEEITAAALSLDPKARAGLAEKLLSSLESLTQGQIEALWVDEAERRNAGLDRTGKPGRPAEEVFRMARQRLV